ncbi:probable ethanolamine kinase isoform X1 [Dysidea avara]|uniref:probable ethanolamine kinase isoform X1 n=1 Tax=Dysidea avara TaxID=196820 RepID=UPI003324418C
MLDEVPSGFVIPHVSLCIDASCYRPGILKLLATIRPEWKHDTVKLKEFEGGLTNCLVGVKSGEEDMLLVRIYGRNTEKFINRESEIKNLVYLNKHIGTPPVYAHFDNGLCYGYVKGTPLELNDLYDKMMMRRIARELARIHALPSPDQDPEHTVLYGSFFSSWLTEIPESLETDIRTRRMKKLIGSVEELRRECDELKSHLDQLNSPIVFCHNDLTYRNIIYSHDKVTFIDLEYGGPNFRGFDIADFFCEFAGSDDVDFSLFPSRDYQLVWLRMYLEEAALLRGEDPNTVTDEMVEDLFVEVNQFTLACHMIWGIWGLIQTHYSLLDFDYLEYAELRIGEYRARRETCLTLKKIAKKKLR